MLVYSSYVRPAYLVFFVDDVLRLSPHVARESVVKRISPPNACTNTNLAARQENSTYLPQRSPTRALAPCRRCKQRCLSWRVCEYVRHFRWSIL